MDWTALGKRLLAATAFVALAAAVWLPCVHLFFEPAEAELPGPAGLSDEARSLAARQVRLWREPDLLAAELAHMRSANAEWDFMARSFLAWSLANMALRDPAAAPAALEVIDRIVAETVRLEAEHGHAFFLMPYARGRPWVAQPPRSLFVDGEIAMMIALRRMVADRDDYKRMLAERVATMVERMDAGPVASAESYPDECWTFCNAIALAAVRVHDYLDGTDHGDLFTRWLRTARDRLIDADTGLLISAYHVDGQPIYGPEGSSIWVAAHFLSLIDEPFAREQYELAKRYLADSTLGFGYSREWPAGSADGMDVDSALVVPGLGASVGASGNAFVGAAGFGDRFYYRSLMASLRLVGFPADGRRYGISNAVGDAVVLYSATLGPAWQRIRQGGER